MPKRNLPDNPITVIGDNLAALASVAALRRLSLPVQWLTCQNSTINSTKTNNNFAQQPGPQLVLNDVALALLSELFPDLHLKGHELTQRVTLWPDETNGPLHAQINPEPAVIAQQSLSIAFADLKQQLSDHLTMQGYKPTVVSDISQITSLTLSSAATLLTQRSVIENHLGKYGIHRQSLISGKRQIVSHNVKLSRHANGADYVVEALTDGWLILAPQNNKVATIQYCATGNIPSDWLDNCLHSSKTIAPLIAGVYPNNTSGAVITAPKIHLPLCGEYPHTQDPKHPIWLIVGEQAANLDPISGEGVPFALRSALLAAAVCHAHKQQNTSSTETLLNHYQARICYSFTQHLKGCSSFYRDSLNHLPGWQEDIDRGEFLAEKLGSITPTRDFEAYKLEHGKLIKAL